MGQSGTPVVILDNGHPPVTESGLILNFHLDQVGNPFQAHALGLDPYRGDPGRIALGIGDMLADRKVSANLFLKATVMR